MGGTQAVVLGEKGRIVIPAEIRARRNLMDGGWIGAANWSEVARWPPVSIPTRSPLHTRPTATGGEVREERIHHLLLLQAAPPALERRPQLRIPVRVDRLA